MHKISNEKTQLTHVKSIFVRCLRSKRKQNTRDFLLTWVLWLQSFTQAQSIFSFCPLSLYGPDVLWWFHIPTPLLDYALTIIWNKCQIKVWVPIGECPKAASLWEDLGWAVNLIVFYSFSIEWLERPPVLYSAHLFPSSMEYLRFPPFSPSSTSISGEANFPKIARFFFLFLSCPFLGVVCTTVFVLHIGLYMSSKYF